MPTKVRSFCVDCGQPLELDNKFCPRCGQSISGATSENLDDDRLFCPMCRQEVMPDAPGVEQCYCPKCGMVDPVSEQYLVKQQQVAIAQMNARGDGQVAISANNKTDVPREIKHFSWPAVLMCLPWMFAQKMYFWAYLATALLIMQYWTTEGSSIHWLIVIANLAIWGYMWFNGNAIAWRSRKYRDVTHFLLVERRWTRVNVAVLIWLVVAVLLFGRVFTMYTGGRAKMESLGPKPTVIKHTDR